MKPEVNKYFKYLSLWREDVRQELDLLDLPENALKICDYGCGHGLTTFSLALEVADSECIGVDKFDKESPMELSTILKYVESLKDPCKKDPANNKALPDELCRLIHENRIPQFHRGDIVSGQNLPKGVDLAYCKRIMINIFQGKHGNLHSGEEGLLAAMEHISNSLSPGGFLCAIEFDGFALESYFQKAKLSIVNRAVIERRDIRSRGRTAVTSKYALYLCKKNE